MLLDGGADLVVAILHVPRGAGGMVSEINSG